MTSKRIAINGKLLRQQLIKHGISQIDLANSVGVSKFTASRWCRNSIHQIKKSNFESIANVFKVSLEELERQIIKPESECAAKLSEQEAELVDAFRKLSQVEKARIRLAIEDIIQEQSSEE